LRAANKQGQAVEDKARADADRLEKALRQLKVVREELVRSKQDLEIQRALVEQRNAEEQKRQESQISKDKLEARQRKRERCADTEWP
jgi:hypothetical protein